MNRTYGHSTSHLPASRSLPLIIGIGSPHGNDQIGWKVIEQLTSQANSCWLGEFRKAAVPHDLLDWLAAERPVHIVDALASDANAPLRLTIAYDAQGSLQASFQDEEDIERNCVFPHLQSNSTHHFDLLSVLQLANALGNLPTQLVLWAIPTGQTNYESSSQARPDPRSVEYMVDICLQRILRELGRS